jgi:hypothetical protein
MKCTGAYRRVLAAPRVPWRGGRTAEGARRRWQVAPDGPSATTSIPSVFARTFTQRAHTPQRCACGRVALARLKRVPGGRFSGWISRCPSRSEPRGRQKPAPPFVVDCTRARAEAEALADAVVFVGSCFAVLVALGT